MPSVCAAGFAPSGPVARHPKPQLERAGGRRGTAHGPQSRWRTAGMPGMLTAVWGGGRAPAAELATLVATCRWPKADELRFPSGFYSRSTPHELTKALWLNHWHISQSMRFSARRPSRTVPGARTSGSLASRRVRSLPSLSHAGGRLAAAPSSPGIRSSSLQCHGAACILGSADGHVAHRLTGAWVWVCEKERLASRARGGLV